MWTDIERPSSAKVLSRGENLFVLAGCAAARLWIPTGRTRAKGLSHGPAGSGSVPRCGGVPRPLGMDPGHCVRSPAESMAGPQSRSRLKEAEEEEQENNRDRNSDQPKKSTFEHVRSPINFHESHGPGIGSVFPRKICQFSAVYISERDFESGLSGRTSCEIHDPAPRSRHFRERCVGRAIDAGRRDCAGSAGPQTSRTKGWSASGDGS